MKPSNEGYRRDVLSVSFRGCEIANTNLPDSFPLLIFGNECAARRVAQLPGKPGLVAFPAYWGGIERGVSHPRII